MIFSWPLQIWIGKRACRMKPSLRMTKSRLSSRKLWAPSKFSSTRRIIKWMWTLSITNSISSAGFCLLATSQAETKLPRTRKFKQLSFLLSQRWIKRPNSKRNRNSKLAPSTERSFHLSKICAIKLSFPSNALEPSLTTRFKTMSTLSSSKFKSKCILSFFLKNF